MVVPICVPPQEPVYICQAVASFNVPAIFNVAEVPGHTELGVAETVGTVGAVHPPTPLILTSAKRFPPAPPPVVHNHLI